MKKDQHRSGTDHNIIHDTGILIKGYMSQSAKWVTDDQGPVFPVAVDDFLIELSGAKNRGAGW